MKRRSVGVRDASLGNVLQQFRFVAHKRQAIKPKKMRQQFFGLCDRRFGKEKIYPNPPYVREF